MRRFFRQVFIMCMMLSSCLPAIARAQQPQYYNDNQNSGQYAEWHAQNADNTALIQELNRLIDKAERERAADWRFLRDLRDTINRYGSTYGRQILFDDFRDGNFTSQPSWQVLSGNFTVDRYGLRTNVTPSANQTSGQSSQKQDDVGSLVFGALLDELARKNGANKSATSQSQADALYIPLAISNAFACQLDVSSLQNTGSLQWGVYADQQRQQGYHIVWNAAATPTLELIVMDRSGSRVLQRQQIPGADLRGRSVQIAWQRNRYGDMQVTVNGQRIISVHDTRFPGNFNAFEIVNQSGEFSIRQVRIDVP